ncbi:NAD(P)-dependent oxidoreductase [Acinetobacter sp. TGL-Y2]|uniref:SDR family oxidoreductase n=1 Tax=Acinetobacter sp. TGL-Y2 TaxID=1407071 RepID=UPI0007A65BF8|nr:SDR family oxidoreductase [Acinetobacter sp. TGL-Y2]AMW78575.1 NAD(P)-dependent oxidoreductase [Acinetobacter sp. TGL-Y2]
MNIAITGATGQLGRFVIESLIQLNSQHHIIALVRDLEKASVLKAQGIEIRHFDYDQPQSLANALKGVDKLLLISANEVGRRTLQHKAVIDAAKIANVPYIAYTSLLRADTSPLGLAQEHRETEALIKQSGLSYTLLRNNWYSENYLASLQHVIETGILFGAAADGQISSATRQDYAEAAAHVLNGTEHHNKTYELAGSQAFTLSDLAELISKASSKHISYQNLSAEDYKQGLAQAGLAPELIEVIVDADVQATQGAMYSEITDLEHILGRATTSIADSIKHTLQV